MKKSIGIDLGTTNSVAAIKKLNAEVLKNAENEYITPSCVTVKKRMMRGPEFIVGRNALEWIRQEPENTITAVKRLIGRNFNDPEVQDLIKGHGLRYGLATHSRGSENSLAILAGGKEYTPEEISSKILIKIRKDAEKSLGGEVDSAVITVPAYFNDKQKHGTRTAANLAGLKVRRLLPEPTAAAISFGVDEISGDEGRTVLVFDFGGGTLDLSILTISGGQIIEMGKGGDMWLGGEDIDGLIIDHVLAATANEEKIDDIRALIDQQESSKKNRFLAELKTAVEKAKIALSDKTKTHVEILGILLDEDGDAFDVEVELSRDQLEAMLEPMLESMILLVRDIIANVHFSNDLIDNVLLVGGSSRTPCVIKAMQQEFGVEKVLLHERPMLAIAEGAAILSHRLADVIECPGCGKEIAQNEATCPHCEFDLEAHTVDQGLVEIVHASAHDYYIKLENDARFLMVEKNSPLPCSHTEVFQLVDVEQELVHMKFYNVVNDKEESIGDLWLGIDYDEEQREDDKPSRIAITIDIDENNLVSVSAALRDKPDVTISKTLSRGKADEKLFLDLEQTVNEADQAGYTRFVVLDLLYHARSIIKSIHGLVNAQTGEVDEAKYKLIKGKLAKAARMAEEGETPRSAMLYAESMLEDYASIIEPAQQKKIQKKIDRLRKANDDSSYEVTIQAKETLDDAMKDERLGVVHLLLKIEHAGQVCQKTDPGKGMRFMRAAEDIVRSLEANDESGLDKLGEIMPEVQSVLQNYMQSSRKIHKDIRK